MIMSVSGSSCASILHESSVIRLLSEKKNEYGGSVITNNS